MCAESSGSGEFIPVKMNRCELRVEFFFSSREQTRVRL